MLVYVCCTVKSYAVYTCICTVYCICIWVFLILSLPQDLVLTTFSLTLMVTVTGLFLMEQHVLIKMVSVNKILLLMH